MNNHPIVKTKCRAYKCPIYVRGHRRYCDTHQSEGNRKYMAVYMPKWRKKSNMINGAMQV